MFLIIILGATDCRARQGFAPIAIGLGLTLIHRARGWYQVGQGAGLVASVLGAILILALYRLVKRAELIPEMWSFTSGR